MCGSGARIGMTPIKAVNSLYITPPVLLPAPAASFAAGRGSAGPPIVAQLTAVAGTRSIGSMIWVSGWPRLTDLLSFLPSLPYKKQRGLDAGHPTRFVCI